MGHHVAMKTEHPATDEWHAEARRILRIELVRREMTYKMLARQLEAIGVEESDRAIAAKVSRGTFSFAFFLQCMQAMGDDRFTSGHKSPAAKEPVAAPKFKIPAGLKAGSVGRK